MRENVVVICPTAQAKKSATDWHDGQFKPLTPQLSHAQQRTPILAAARLLQADETAVEAAAVELLAVAVIAALPEIQPDDAVAGAMPLRLLFIAERRERLRARLARQQDDDRCQDKQHDQGDHGVV